MQININIDPNFPRWLKRVALYGLVPALVVIGAAVHADVSVPQFASGDRLSAATMNANFATLTQAINSQSTTIAQLSAKLSADEVTIAKVNALAEVPTFQVTWIPSGGPVTISSASYSTVFDCGGYTWADIFGTTSSTFAVGTRLRLIAQIDNLGGGNEDTQTRGVKARLTGIAEADWEDVGFILPSGKDWVETQNKQVISHKNVLADGRAGNSNSMNIQFAKTVSGDKTFRVISVTFQFFQD